MFLKLTNFRFIKNKKCTNIIAFISKTYDLCYWFWINDVYYDPITALNSSHEDGDVTIRPMVIQLGDSTLDPADSLYGVALVAAVGAALTMAILGFAFGWYT